MSIQLTKFAKDELTKIINKTFVLSSAGHEVRAILDNHIIGENHFRDIYPFQQGPDVQVVNELVDKLYSIYIDIAKYINEAEHPIDGVLKSEDTETTLSTMITRFSSALDSNENREYKVNILPKNKFSSLVRDGLVASIIRGYRIHVLATNPDLGGGNLAALFAGDNRRKYIDNPLETFDSSQYAQKNVASAKVKHKNLWYPHDDDPKLPYNELGKQTLAIFLQKPGVFSSFIRKRYGIDSDHILRNYPSDKVEVPDEALEEAFNKNVDDMDSGNVGLMPAIEYVYLFLKRFIRTLLLNATDKDSLVNLFREADSALSAGGDKEDNEVNVGETSELDYFNTESDTNQFTEVLDQEEGNVKNPDILPKNVASEFGGEDRHIITILCNEVLSELCTKQDQFAAQFDFHALENRGGVGDIVEKNLYYGFIRPLFEHYDHSESGIQLIYHFYNSIGKDNIGLTVTELENLKSQLPKNGGEIKLLRGQTTDLASKIDLPATGKESVNVAIEVANRVFEDGIGNHRFIQSEEAKFLSDPLKRLLNPSACTITPTLLSEMKSLWNVTQSKTVEEARRTTNIMTAPSKSEAVDSFFNIVKTSFDNLDPDNGYSISRKPGKKDYVYLYPTESNRELVKFDIFPDREAFRSAYHSLLTNLMSLRQEIVASDDITTLASLITQLLQSHFPNSKFWSLTPVGSKINIGSILLPSVTNESGNLIELKDLTTRNRASNASNMLIKNILTTTEATTTSLQGVPKESSKQIATVNIVYSIIAMLHCRIEFLIAVKKFSDEIVSIFNEYRPTVEQIPPEDRVLLSDYDKVNTERVKDLLKTLVDNVSFKKRKFAELDSTEHPEIENLDQIVNSPKYEEHLTKRRTRADMKKAALERAANLKSLRLDDDL